MVALAMGISSANALVLCVNSSGSVTAVTACKPGWTPLDVAAAGLAGPPGPQGLQGVQGVQGPQGDPGASGSSTVLGTKGTTMIGKAFGGVPWTTMVTVNLGAGTHLLSADGVVNRLNNGGGSGIAVQCQFTGGGVKVVPFSYFSVLVGDTVSVSIAGRVTLAAAGTATLECSHNDFADSLVEGVGFELLAQGVTVQAN